MAVRRSWLLVVILLGLALAWDLARVPANQFSAAALVAGISLYQSALSPLASRAGVRCRFEPTCSHYAKAVIAKDGALRGGFRTMARIARCGPWTPAGTADLP